MGSRKKSARARETADFKAQLGEQLGGMDDLFEREERRQADLEIEKEAALRYKACESKNRYSSRGEAEEAIRNCADHGTRGLHCYRCPHCNGWHLTSKQPAN